ncbi:hypothetical protein KXX09_004297 [Aspergillus fumigatus]|nr:hypothetical protein KXX09_004297 [Aspergillus fumigatus]
MNGFLASILAWLNGAKQTVGQRDFLGLTLYTSADLEEYAFPKACKTALMERIKCDSYMLTFMEPSYRGTLHNDTLTDSICDNGCGYSLSLWFNSVNQNCAGYNITGAVPPMLGGRLWAAYNETCIKDTKTGEYCNVEGDTCDSIAQTNGLSSAALYMGNQDQIYNCSKIEANLNLCLPLPCGQTYVLQPDDTCTSIESATSLQVGDLRAFNPWISFACDNLHIASKIYGKTLCLTPQGGVHNSSAPNNGSSTTPSFSDGYVYATTLPPTNATIAEGSTTNCGRWHEARENETCAAICVEEGITSPLFLAVNPSLNPVDCTSSLRMAWTYCVGPTYTWNLTFPDDDPTSSSSNITVVTASPTAGVQ